jgi:hypothetical protein
MLALKGHSITVDFPKERGKLKHMICDGTAFGHVT